MPFNEPLQTQIYERIRADFEAELEGADARLRFTFERVASKVLGKASFYAHRHIAYLSRQPFPDTADVENLDRQILIWGLEDGQGGIGRNPARAATGIVQVGGASPGSISAGDFVVRADGLRYSFDENTSFPGGTEVKDLAVTAEDVGDVGNTDAGTTLEFEADHTGINTDTLVGPDGLTLGADRESDEDAIVRLLAKIREPGSGGGPGDYITWALAADVNVTRAYEQPLQLGDGTVRVVIVNDNLSPPEPSPALVQIVQDYIQTKTLLPSGIYQITGFAPVTATVTVIGVDTKLLPFSATVTLEEGVTQASATAAIEAEMAAFLKRIAEPAVTISISQILGTIMNSAGILDATLTVPAAPTTHNDDQIPIPGTFSPTYP